ncbi:MAG: hypothetical protein K6E83_11335 [Clostridium sp.]|nr:hypothetical protein [Clostridium sp.]
MKLTVALSVAAVVLAMMAGCVRNTHAETEASSAETAAGTGTSSGSAAGGRTELPDGVTLDGLKYSRWGMRMNQNYSIRRTAEGYECAITRSEVYWPEIDGEETAEYYDYDPETGYGYDHSSSLGDPFDPSEKFSRVTVQKNEMDELCDGLVEAGVLAWDGYDGKWTPPVGMEVTDTGETFDLLLLFSDGQVLHAHGVDTEPDNFNEVWSVISDFFEGHQDYSRYYPTDFPDEPIESLTVKFYNPYRHMHTPVWNIELHKSWENQWIITMNDPQGEFLPAGTDISEYDRLGESAELPIDRFYGILKKYSLGEYNQEDTHDPEKEEHWNVIINYENGQRFDCDTNLQPEGYEEFRREMIQAIIDTYETYKGPIG